MKKLHRYSIEVQMDVLLTQEEFEMVENGEISLARFVEGLPKIENVELTDIMNYEEEDEQGG